LIRLSADSEPKVRDWATFGLARQTEQDFPQLRAALADRLADDDPDTLAEAIHGLAVRGDEQAVQPLVSALRSPQRFSDPNVLTEALYALAVATADPRLHPYLAQPRGEGS
jgi:HEAT repeat protein